MCKSTTLALPRLKMVVVHFLGKYMLACFYRQYDVLAEPNMALF